MCGIFGIVLSERTTVSVRTLERAARELFRLSEARGKESAGLAVRNGGPIQVLKQAIPASVMVRSPAFREILHGTFQNGAGPAAHGALIGHSRLVTNGAQENNANNQPVIADGMVCIHNGIITNDEALWRRHPDLKREFEVDTEVLLRLIRKHEREGRDLTDAVRAAFGEIQGYASIAALFNDRRELLLATNNGSLYRLSSDAHGVFVFASEEFILKTFAARRELSALFAGEPVRRVEPGEGCWVNLASLSTRSFDLAIRAGLSSVRPAHRAEDSPAPMNREAVSPAPINREEDSPGPMHRDETGPALKTHIVDLSQRYDEQFRRHRVRAYVPEITTGRDDLSLLDAGHASASGLKRCTRCVLPESYPFITFDAAGVCSHCQRHKAFVPYGADALAQAVEKFRRRDGRPDCLVAVSGGRDSTYGLHYMKNVLGMNPVAYTYDWGMVTDLARRNISRICGKLGVEHLLVSADINKKRANIRKNILAWLKRPELGVIPLFMAGDKHFFYHANRLTKQTGIDLVIWCSGSAMEDADFKWYFCGFSNQSETTGHKLRLLRYYGAQFLKNPAYINSSILDTLSAYWSYYMLPHDYIFLFKFLPWNEDEIMGTLREKYDWEQAGDTTQTWRIGDGTASFYNYIYHTVAGFSENDTFRSEQVRRGMITRGAAMAFLEEENMPRYESIKWYLSVVGLGDAFNHVISTVNAMPKLFFSIDLRCKTHPNLIKSLLR